MKCQFCSKSKAYEITEIEDNKAKSTIALCQDCFVAYIQGNSVKPKKEIKINPKAADAFVQEMMEFVENLVNQTVKPANPAVKPKQPNKKACPKCNTSILDIGKTGKLGCSYCYEWYKNELQQTLFLSHGTPNSPEQLSHVGKIPKKFKRNPEQRQKEETDKMRLTKLKYKLAQAVEREDYETAAKIRDIVKDVETLIEEENKYEKEQS